MAPEDIKITYSETDPNNNLNKDNNKLEPETDPQEPMTSAVFGANSDGFTMTQLPAAIAPDIGARDSCYKDS